MNIRGYSTLHLDPTSSKRTALLLLFCISQTYFYLYLRVHIPDSAYVSCKLCESKTFIISQPELSDGSPWDGRTDEEQIFPVVPVNQTLMGNNIVLRVHVVVKMCFRIIYKLLRVMILLVTQFQLT